MKKIIIIILISVTVLAAAGYWYLEIYQPKQFARELVVVYRDFQIGVQSVIPSDQPVRGLDEENLVKKYEAVTETARTKLSALKPPRKMKSIHKDFVEFLDAFQLFISNFKSGGFDQALSDLEEEQAKRGNDLDRKIQGLIKTYGLNQ